MSIPSSRFKIAGTLFNDDMRVAQIIHVPTMVAGCPENLPEVVERFFEDELSDNSKSLREGAASFLSFVSKHAADLGDDFRNSELALHLARQRQIEFFVNVEWPVRNYYSRGARFPLGGFMSSWGHYATRWYAGPSIASCVKQARAEATKEWRAAWEKAPEKTPAKAAP